jgi:hypothetical protein
MKRICLSIVLIIMVFLAVSLTGGCKKPGNVIKYQYGTFRDTVVALDGLNSAYDDYNSDLHVLGTEVPIIFSSNRGSSGGQFDLVTGTITYQFDQTNGNFSVSGAMSTDPFYTAIVNKANSTGNEYGPYTLFSTADGYEYLFFASQTSGSPLDLYYERYLPRNGNILPVISGPYPLTKINSSSDDAYLTFDSNRDSLYFCSNQGGNFDIYVQPVSKQITLPSWLAGAYASSNLVDSLNSSANDKCPFIYKNIMVFASDRSGGLGGFDLYYSLFRDGKWGAPVNFGPGINTSSDEYRPVIGFGESFTNQFIVFSSNRPGGKGGFDLYFTGYDFPKQ